MGAVRDMTFREILSFISQMRELVYGLLDPDGFGNTSK